MSQQALWSETVGKTIALQWAVVAGLAAAAWLIWGRSAGLSLLCGGGAVALPNSLLALWLTLRVYTKGNAGAVAMLSGEILKIMLTVACLTAAVMRLKPELSMLALIVGVVAALKAQWLALWVTRKV